MNAQTQESRPAAASPESITTAVTAACAQIAPAWPLDQSVAVNPLWPLRNLPIAHAAARLAARGGVRLLPSRAEFRRYFQQGRITRENLAAAGREAVPECTVENLIAHLDRPPATARLPLVADQIDRARNLTRRTAWTEEIVHQVSQLCAAEFDLGQGDWPRTDAAGLYAAWRYNVGRDRGVAILMGRLGLARHFRALPPSADELIQTALGGMGVPAESMPAYLHALLLSVNGWASWCAYRSWQANLHGAQDATLRELLAIRLAWDWVLYSAVADETTRCAWRHALTQSAALEAGHERDQAQDWLWQRALELGYERKLVHDLKAPHAEIPAAPRARVQLAFCIDVRSEVFRRALEAEAPGVETLGFAGFFGVPMAYQPFGTDLAQPQLPGLLAPAMTAIERGDDGRDGPRLASVQNRLGSADVARRFRWGNTSTFSYVEATGLLYAVKLVRNGLLQRPSTHATNAKRPADSARLKPELRLDGAPLPLEAKVALAAGILRGLSLTRGFAPLVVLTGHASQASNNPQQSALDCGACGGHSGEVNARIAAALLNEATVRAGLRAERIDIPGDTRFIPALHNTTTDDVRLFDLAALDAEGATRIDALRGWLDGARNRTNLERAARLAPRARTAAAARQALDRRARDWSQLRPEWGLAGNASLIVAQRSRTRGLDLAGRAFLHDYDERQDPDHAVLEQIMTAPMLVSQWINLQYYASTVDNRVYGSGNKTLHNVVGGHIGVFEGNGGDLRIGLSLQSLRDGEQWVHEPLRLAVFIQAGADAIAAVIARHETLRDLVDHHWLAIYRIGKAQEPIHRYRAGRWLAVGSP